MRHIVIIKEQDEENSDDVTERRFKEKNARERDYHTAMLQKLKAEGKIR